MSFSVIQEHYLNGKLDGIREVSFPYGKSRSFYQCGKLTGIRTFWYPNGAICLQECYLNEKLEGKFQSKNGDGSCRVIAFFKNDRRNGERKEYRNGELYTYKFYRRGKCIDSHFTPSKKAVFLSLKHKLYAQSIDHKNLSNFLISDLFGI